MAQGDLTMFEEFSLTIGQSIFDFTTSTGDTFKLALLDTIPSASLATPTWSDVSGDEVSGTGYTSGGATFASTTWAEAAGTATFDEDTGPPSVTWGQNGAGPTDIRAGVIYSDTATNDDLICFIDFTPDGSSPISLVDGDITWAPNASGIFTLG